LLIFWVKIGQFFQKNPEPNKLKKTNKFRLALSTLDQGFLGFFLVLKFSKMQKKEKEKGNIPSQYSHVFLTKNASQVAASSLPAMTGLVLDYRK
jgi:hypothetical protein